MNLIAYLYLIYTRATDKNYGILRQNTHSIPRDHSERLTQDRKVQELSHPTSVWFFECASMAWRSMAQKNSFPAKQPLGVHHSGQSQTILLMVYVHTSCKFKNHVYTSRTHIMYIHIMATKHIPRQHTYVYIYICVCIYIYIYDYICYQSSPGGTPGSRCQVALLDPSHAAHEVLQRLVLLVFTLHAMRSTRMQPCDSSKGALMLALSHQDSGHSNLNECPHRTWVNLTRQREHGLTRAQRNEKLGTKCPTVRLTAEKKILSAAFSENSPLAPMSECDSALRGFCAPLSPSCRPSPQSPVQGAGRPHGHWS